MAINEMTAGFEPGTKVRIVNPDTGESVHDTVEKSDGKMIFTKAHPTGKNNWVRKNSTGGKIYHMNDPWQLELAEESIQEDGEAPTNAVGTGHIAGASPGQDPPMGRRKQRTFAERGKDLQDRYVGNVRRALKGPGFQEATSPAENIMKEKGWEKKGRVNRYDVFVNPKNGDERRIRRPGFGMKHTSEFLDGLKAAEMREGWVRGKDGQFSAESSEIEHHPGDIHCPGCGKVLESLKEPNSHAQWKTHRDRDNDVSHWTHEHKCGSKLTIFND